MMRRILVFSFLFFSVCVSVYGSESEINKHIAEVFSSRDVAEWSIQLKQLKLCKIPYQQLLISIEKKSCDQLIITPFVGRAFHDGNQPCINLKYFKNKEAVEVFSKITEYVSHYIQDSEVKIFLQNLPIGTVAITGFNE